MNDERDLQDVHRLEIAGELTRQDVEALELEIRQLAKRNDVPISTLRIETIEDES